MDTTWREELSWAAGFCDGECHIRANWLHGRFWQVRVDITQTDRRVLDRFRRAVGNVGKVYGPYAHRSPKHRARYQYSAVGSHAQAVIALLWTWLDVVKRDQARGALLKVRMTADHRSSRFQEMCKRGHALTDEKNVFVYYKGAVKFRVCRTCAREKQAHYRQRRLAHTRLVAV